MKDQKLKNFIKKWAPCPEGAKWGLSVSDNGEKYLSEIWEELKTKPRWCLYVLTRYRILDGSKIEAPFEDIGMDWQLYGDDWLMNYGPFRDVIYGPNPFIALEKE